MNVPAVKINHVAIFVRDLESMKDFYQKHFGFDAGERYENKSKGFSSYFLTTGNIRIELMNRIDHSQTPVEGMTGLHHIAFSLGNKKAVDEKTKYFRKYGVPVISGPRTTGDGYYESVIRDPEGNVIELTV